MKRGSARAMSLVALAVVCLTQQADAQSIEQLRLTAADGGAVHALAAGPEHAEAAVLLLHDWFGVTEATRDALRRIAELGYRGLALDLYDGESAATHAGAGQLSGALEPSDVRRKLEAALAALRTEGFDRIATLGFSMGGNPAFAAARLGSPEVRGAAVVYGGGMESLTDEELAGLEFPLLLVTGSDDAWPMTTVQALLPRMNAVGSELEVYVYPRARHGYAQPLYAAGANLDAGATEATWEVLESFLARNLAPVKPEGA